MRIARTLGVSCLALVSIWIAQSRPANSFHFAIVGDRTGETVAGVYEQVWREVAADHPDFAINTGDTIQGYNDSVAESEWRSVKPVWTKYRVPYFLTPGNHDIWSAFSRRIYEKRAHRPAFYGLDYQNAHFTVLDNSGSFQLSADQMRFLEQDLKSSQGRSPRFVLFHQPFWIIPLKLGNTDFTFHRLMLQYHVKYVLGGHTHQFSRLERDGVVYTVVGSSGGHLRGHNPMRDFEQGWFFQHVEVSVQGDEVKMMVRETGPPFGKGRSFDASKWSGG